MKIHLSINEQAKFPDPPIEILSKSNKPASYVNKANNLIAENPNGISKSDLSTVKICETLTTLCFWRFASPGNSRTFPGASARLRFEVSAHTTTVLIRL